MGAEDLYILCDPHAEPFYVRMGAARVGEQVILSGALERIMPVLKIKL